MLATGKGSAADIQLVMLDRIHDSQSGVGGIARQQDHFNLRLSRRMCIEGKQLSDQSKGNAGLQHFVLMVELIAVVGDNALFLEYAVRFLKVK